MQAMINTISNAPGLCEIDAQSAANQYLSKTLGGEYQATNGFYGQGRWYFRICCQRASQERGNGVGKLAVDANAGTVIALTEEQIRTVHDTVAFQIAQAGGELARDERGCLLCYQAQIQATQWLGEKLSMHFSATDGLFVPTEHPLWQFTIRFELPRLGEIKPLGMIDVDAMTGGVKSLSRQQLHKIQERVREIIRHRQLATAA